MHCNMIWRGTNRKTASRRSLRNLKLRFVLGNGERRLPFLTSRNQSNQAETASEEWQRGRERSLGQLHNIWGKDGAAGTTPITSRVYPTKAAAPTVRRWGSNAHNFCLTHRSKQHPPFDDVGGVSERVLLALEMKRPPTAAVSPISDDEFVSGG
jgi:hypothetical protein